MCCVSHRETCKYIEGPPNDAGATVINLSNIIHQTKNENPRFLKPNILHLYPCFAAVYYVRTAITLSGPNPEASELLARGVFFSS